MISAPGTPEYTAELETCRANLVRLIAYFFEWQGDPEELIKAVFAGSEQTAAAEAFEVLEWHKQQMAEATKKSALPLSRGTKPGPIRGV
jgi:hypothetical protein